MEQPDLSEVLNNVWHQALVDESDFVKLGTRRYPVVTLKAKHLRQVQFEFGGKAIIGIEQNSNTNSRWAERARSGVKVMQFIVEGDQQLVSLDVASVSLIDGLLQFNCDLGEECGIEADLQN
jgi:hypothetical protein